MNTDINTPTPEPLLRLADADRARLGEALQALLAHGSILGLEPGDSDLYAWSRQNFDWLREMAALAGLAVSMEHESRLIQAVPERPALTLNLRQDVTIVLLALWYEYDTQVRDHGAARVTLSVEQLNQLLKEKLLPDLKSQPSAGRMLEILRQARRFNLIRFETAQPFEQSRIEVLKILPRVIQFNEIAEWTRTADLHKNPQATLSDAAEKDRLYRCLDRMVAHKEGLERHLAEKWRDLFGASFDVLLYDLTSTYFEGEAVEVDKARRGYSRDHRPDCLQILLAVVVTPEGFPISYEVLPGNVRDEGTLDGALEAIERKHGKARRIWVFDRGVASEANLQTLRERGAQYVVGTPRSRLKEYEQRLLGGDWQEISKEVQVQLLHHTAGGGASDPAAPIGLAIARTAASQNLQGPSTGCVDNLSGKRCRLPS